jgi:CBS domain-containing protein
MFQARDIMTTHVVCVRTDDTIDRAIALMVRHRISGLPVLDPEGRPVGIISEFDLLALICEGLNEKERVSRYMSPDLVGVEEEDCWTTVADIFRSKHIRRLPVMRQGKLVGIVTRHDLMHAIRDARQRLRNQLVHEGSKKPAALEPDGATPARADKRKTVPK